MYRTMTKAESRFIINYLVNHLDEMNDKVLVFSPRVNKFKWLPLVQVGEDPLDSDVLITVVETTKLVSVLSKTPEYKRKLQDNLLHTFNSNESNLLKGYHFKDFDLMTKWIKKTPYTPMIVEALTQGSHKVVSTFLGQYEDESKVDQLLASLPIAKGKTYYRVYPMKRVQVDA